jgi:hypothetical protein
MHGGGFRTPQRPFRDGILRARMLGGVHGGCARWSVVFISVSVACVGVACVFPRD